MSANDFIPCGAPLHSNGGETLTPSQVYWRGIAWRSGNAVLVNLNSILLSFGLSAAGFKGAGVGWLVQPSNSRAITEIVKVETRPRIVYLPRKLRWTARRRWRWSHASLHQVDHILMRHVEAENDLVAVGRSFRALQQNLLVFSLSCIRAA